MGALTNLARRWANPRLVKEADQLRFQLVTAEATIERLKVEMDSTHLRLLDERDDARRQVAELASENVVLTDRVRHLEASLSGTREELRQERVERARAVQDAAEHAVTVDGLGLAMAELEKRQERGEVGA